MNRFFQANRKKIYLLSLAILLYMLINFTPEKQRIFSTESLYDTLDFSENISRNLRRNFILSFFKSHIEIHIGSGKVPILITGLVDDMHIILILINYLQRMECFGRTVKIKMFYEKEMVLKAKENYFAIIDLQFKERRDFLIYDIFNLTIPNSDLLFLFNLHFKLIHRYSIGNISTGILPVNLLYLNLSKNSRSLKKLCKVIRLIQNMESHSLGTYYYLPLNKQYIPIEKIMIPCIIILLPYMENNNINYFTSLFFIIVILLGQFSLYFYFLLIVLNNKLQFTIVLILLAISFNLFILYLILLSVKYPWNFLRIYRSK